MPSGILPPELKAVECHTHRASMGLFRPESGFYKFGSQRIFVDARKFIFQVTFLTSLSPSLPRWHLSQTVDLIYSAGGTA